MRVRRNYVNNKDMLAEIHKSKISFCEYDDPAHTWFDFIINTVPPRGETEPPDNILDMLDKDVIIEAKERRAARIADIGFRAAQDAAVEDQDLPKPKLSEFKFDPTTIKDSELVFRVMTYEHIDLEPGRKTNPKTQADHRVRVYFLPFKHYVINELPDGTREPKLVLTSHHKDGVFNPTYGSITDKLARMIMLMVNKYGQRSNWRGYTYLDEMKGQALLQLSQMALQFNEAKSNNPFSYYTQSISNSFTYIFNTEKKNQNIRDDLLEKAGMTPSSTRQLAIEEEIRKMRNEAAQEE